MKNLIWVREGVSGHPRVRYDKAYHFKSGLNEKVSHTIQVHALKNGNPDKHLVSRLKNRSSASLKSVPDALGRVAVPKKVVACVHSLRKENWPVFLKTNHFTCLVLSSLLHAIGYKLNSDKCHLILYLTTSSLGAMIFVASLCFKKKWKRKDQVSPNRNE